MLQVALWLPDLHWNEDQVDTDTHQCRDAQDEPGVDDAQTQEHRGHQRIAAKHHRLKQLLAISRQDVNDLWGKG